MALCLNSFSLIRIHGHWKPLACIKWITGHRLSLSHQLLPLTHCCELVHFPIPFFGVCTSYPQGSYIYKCGSIKCLIFCKISNLWIVICTYTSMWEISPTNNETCIYSIKYSRGETSMYCLHESIVATPNVRCEVCFFKTCSGMNVRSKWLFHIYIPDHSWQQQLGMSHCSLHSGTVLAVPVHFAWPCQRHQICTAEKQPLVRDRQEQQQQEQ